jgi:hypothetical protein
MTDPAATLASAQNGPGAVALDSHNLYWVDTGGGTVMSAPLDGGAPVTLASGLTSPGAIAVDGSGVYFTTTDSVLTVPLDGGAPTTLAAGQMLSGPFGLAVDATSVYWANFGGNAIAKVAKP